MAMSSINKIGEKLQFGLTEIVLVDPYLLMGWQENSRIEILITAIGVNQYLKFDAILFVKVGMEKLLIIGEVFAFNFSNQSFHPDGLLPLGIVTNL